MTKEFLLFVPQMKKELSDNESITQEVVGNAHIENYALKLFLYADNEDRAGRFHKNMIKSFYSSSLLMDVLSVFGELSEENVQHRKYARWKATYIHNCLKNGESPQPGPIAMEGDEEAAGAAAPHPKSPGSSCPGSVPTGPPTTNYNNIQIPPGAHAPANTPAELQPPSDAGKPHPAPRSGPAVDPALLSAQQQGGVQLTPEDFTRAQKYCKYAGSALQYEDVSTAVQNLQKALKLLTTGKE
uniref:Vesicle (multivesicular body) trafficking 1 n=1 Tax=Kryptolebias marmoratus TaxID=37003 RepID=A0A3Q3A2D8_KRYMA